MDRRQRKSREAIFSALIKLLSQNKFDQITVGDIIEEANVGRATFYAHFETKQFLLKSLCDELFCHIFDGMEHNSHAHRHIFDCNPPESVFLHLFQHIAKNDNHILDLLSGCNNELFLGYFEQNLKGLIMNQLPCFQHRKNPLLPQSYWIDHICATFIHTVKWWVNNGMTDSPETISEYFTLVV